MSHAREKSGLLLLDVFNTFDFPGGDELYRETLKVLEPIQKLAERFRQSHRPVIFINDNAGRWQDDFNALLSHVKSSGAKGARMVDALYPQQGDYKLLKPRHSAFFETPLPSLLSHFDVRRVVVCGIAADSCVLSTVMDAHTRGIEALVPADGTASQTPERTARVLAHLRESSGVDTPPSSKVTP